MPDRHVLLLLIVSMLLLVACGRRDPEPLEREAAAVAAPLPGDEAAYSIASAQPTLDTEAADWPDLHNVIRLSESIVSGSEPHGEQALRRIAETWGVKTILSVDGKAPDVETAARYGMTYVHVPIQYSGITAEERMRISKVFREMEGPFFVHCYHGKHRGPAAAALGRVVLDGASRERAIAEMLHCGTSSQYEGLYETVARAEVPSAQASASYAWDFPGAQAFQGLRSAMIEAARVSDRLEALAARDWTEDPAHPDLHAGNEAAKLLDVFGKTVVLKEIQDRPADFRQWLLESASFARGLEWALTQDPIRPDEARQALNDVRGLCSACHRAYRNTDAAER